MTAADGGSIQFVTAVFTPAEAQDMYAMPPNVDPRLRTSPALREYARLEFGDDAYASVILSDLPRNLRNAARKPRLRLRLLRPRRDPRPVACKGAPRRQANGSSVRA